MQRNSLKIGGRLICFLLAIVDNIRNKGKCIEYNLPINLAKISNKNNEMVQWYFEYNLAILNK